MKNMIIAIPAMVALLMGCSTVRQQPAAPPLDVTDLLGTWEGTSFQGDEYFRLDINGARPSYAYEISHSNVVLYAIQWELPNERTHWRPASVLLFELTRIGDDKQAALCSLSRVATNRVWVTFSMDDLTLREIELHQVSESHLELRTRGEDQLKELRLKGQQPQQAPGG